MHEKLDSCDGPVIAPHAPYAIMRFPRSVDAHLDESGLEAGE